MEPGIVLMVLMNLTASLRNARCTRMNVFRHKRAKSSVSLFASLEMELSIVLDLQMKKPIIDYKNNRWVSVVTNVGTKPIVRIARASVLMTYVGMRKEKGAQRKSNVFSIVWMMIGNLNFLCISFSCSKILSRKQRHRHPLVFQSTRSSNKRI